MATGVQPRDEENSLTRSDLETIQEAMKDKKFRELLNDYCEEMTDPANQELYQKEMTQLEKERGYDITFLNPKGGYVIKTSVAGDRKAFINVCSNENVAKPTYKMDVVNGKRGMNWKIPYTMTPPRDDYNMKKKEKLVIYDVVFHPYTLRMAQVNKEFRDLVNKTAIEGLQKSYNIHFDSNNCRFPKSYYKGMTTPSVIRKEDPTYKPPDDEESENISPEILEKLYPQRTYQEPAKESESPLQNETQQPQSHQQHLKEKPRKEKVDFKHNSNNGYTVPKYFIKQQKAVDLQDYTFEKDCKQFSAIPSSIVIEIYLPMLSTTKDCDLDVQEKYLNLISEKPAKYKLNISLPYSVDDESGNAKFDKTKHMLIVTLPVLKKNSVTMDKSLKFDSGVESEEHSSSQSEDENCKDNLIVEISSTKAADSLVEPEKTIQSIDNKESFLDSSLHYLLPTYTHNVLDDIVAFTFHVKNTEPDSVKVRKDRNKVYIKFTSVGSGFVPVHYAAIMEFEETATFENVSGEAWDNNVILQLETASDIPHKFQIGLTSDSMTNEYFDISQIKKASKLDSLKDEEALPVVEVTNLGTETNIVVSSHDTELDEDDIESPISKDEEFEWTDSGVCENGAKSILRKPINMRSFSESSMGEVASSMDYISSDCIPEESSLKKTVRFNDVIARQFYRYNSSIEGQKKKNQRKKSKRRTQDRLRSESEAEDDITCLSTSSKPRLKSAMKQRRDSGLADTSDADGDYNDPPDTPPVFDTCDSWNGNEKHFSHNNEMDPIENRSNSVLNIVNNKEENEEKPEPAIWKTSKDEGREREEWEEVNNQKKDAKSESVTCDNIQHNTNLYNPDKLNKGQYLEVTFKNDLIFDLDM